VWSEESSWLETAFVLREKYTCQIYFATKLLLIQQEWVKKREEKSFLIYAYIKSF